MVDQVWAVIWYIYIYHFLLLTETCVVYAVYYCWRRITLTCDGGYDSICQFSLIRIILIKYIMTAIFGNGAWLSKTYSESISNKESWTWLYLNLYSSLCLLITLRICLLLQGIYSLGGQTSYRMISWNFKVARFGFRRLQSHTMDLLWGKFQWILPLYMKPINFQSGASVVCSVTAAISIDFCLKKLKVFSQHIGQKTNEYLNSAEQVPRNWHVDQHSVLNTSWDIA